MCNVLNILATEYDKIFQTEINRCFRLSTNCCS